MASTLQLTRVNSSMLAHQAELLPVRAGLASVRIVPLLHLGRVRYKLRRTTAAGDAALGMLHGARASASSLFRLCQCLRVRKMEAARK
jgi:phosphotransacetylase